MDFQMCEPFKFSNTRFFYPYKKAEKISNETFFHQIVWQNLQRKNFGLSVNDIKKQSTAFILFFMHFHMRK